MRERALEKQTNTSKYTYNESFVRLCAIVSPDVNTIIKCDTLRERIVCISLNPYH